MKLQFARMQKLFLFVFCSAIVLFACQKNEQNTEKEDIQGGKSVATGQMMETNLAAGCTGTGVNHFITLADAKKMIDRYQAAVKNRTIGEIYSLGGWVNSETYSGDAIIKILSQPGCCKFRIYNGIGSDNRQHMIIVGTNTANEDIIYTSSRSAITANTNAGDPPPPLIVNIGAPCPSICIGTYTNP